jgi:4'-phosphopantetheinyl transferase
MTALPDAERARFERFKHERSAHEFLAGRLLVRQWLAALTGYLPNDWQFVEGFRGRPEIAHPATSLRFNLAHSGGVVACIMTDGREAGVDVEDLGRRPVEADLWHRYCAPSEVADIEAQPAKAQHHRFLTYWTLKEAYLKAIGLGIGVHLADIAFHVGAGDPTIHFHDSLAGTSTDWAFGMTAASDQFLVSWATPQPPSSARPGVEIIHIPLLSLDPAR